VLKPRAVLVVVCLLSGSCGPSLGRRGTLGFAYHATDQLLAGSMERPLARGTEARAVVYAPRQRGARPHVVWGRKTLSSPEAIQVESATTSDCAVLQVLGVHGSRVRLRGVSVGRSELTVHTARGADVIAVTVAETHHVELDHVAWAEPGVGPGRTVLLAGGTVHFIARRVDARGRAMAGLHPAGEIAVSPGSRARIVDRRDDESHLRLALGQPGRLAITPRVGTGYVFEVVPVLRVSTLSVDFVRARGAAGPVRLGRSDAIWLRVTARTGDGQWALGLDGPLQLRSATPARCRLRSLARWFGDGLFALRGVTAGECRLEARLGAVSREVRVAVE